MMPEGMLLRIKSNYDETFYNWLGSDHSCARFYVKWTMNHAKSHFVMSLLAQDQDSAMKISQTTTGTL